MIADLGRALAQREDRVSEQLSLSSRPHQPSPSLPVDAPYLTSIYFLVFSWFFSWISGLSIHQRSPTTYRPTRAVTSNSMTEEDSDVSLLVPTRSDSAMSLLSQVSMPKRIIDIVSELLRSNLAKSPCREAQVRTSHPYRMGLTLSIPCATFLLVGTLWAYCWPRNRYSAVLRRTLVPSRLTHTCRHSVIARWIWSLDAFVAATGPIPIYDECFARWSRVHLTWSYGLRSAVVALGNAGASLRARHGP
ncbi:hypothetical protein C8Q74DRAFT_1286581 [Fomes fomentarius]|nr:hypothetical protein C8Q74DRAFT_1286581 [Fomes fomentarius]